MGRYPPEEQMAWDGAGSDTRELLREVGSEARSAYYSASSSRLWFYAAAMALFLGSALFGLWLHKPTGYVFIAIGVLGLLMIGMLLGLRR